MGVAYEFAVDSKKGLVSEAEWEQRVNLAALYRLIAAHGWDELVFTHVSARVPGPEHHFLINPYGVFFEEVTASCLMKVDLDGTIVDDSPFELNQAGFTVHSAVHGAREDAKVVIHLHTDNGAAVSAQAHGLLPATQTAMFIREEVSYHDFEGITFDLEERARLGADLGDKNLMILRNHGTLALGETCAEAWLRFFFLERACTMQIKALSGGGALHPVTPGIPEKVGSQFRGIKGIADKVWAGSLRWLDRRDPSYRD